MGEKKIRGKNKKIIIGLAILIVILGVIIKITIFPSTRGGGSVQQFEVVPLSEDERTKVAQVLISSDFMEDVPAKNPIALTFYDFQDGQQIFRDTFLIADGEFLSEGEPVIYLYLPSRYISEFDGDNLCEITTLARNNGELGFHSESNKAMLFIKYAGLLKYRDCFGF